jgi:tetratricopeptide (TPR) repeat protein
VASVLSIFSDNIDSTNGFNPPIIVSDNSDKNTNNLGFIVTVSDDYDRYYSENDIEKDIIDPSDESKESDGIVASHLEQKGFGVISEEYYYASKDNTDINVAQNIVSSESVDFGIIIVDNTESKVDPVPKSTMNDTVVTTDETRKMESGTAWVSSQTKLQSNVSDTNFSTRRTDAGKTSSSERSNNTKAYVSNTIWNETGKTKSETSAVRRTTEILPAKADRKPVNKAYYRNVGPSAKLTRASSSAENSIMQDAIFSAIRNERYIDAINFLKGNLEKNSKDRLSFFYLGLTFYASSDFSGATRAFYACLNLDSHGLPDFLVEEFDSAESLENLYINYPGVELLIKSVELNPRDKSLYLNLFL